MTPERIEAIKISVANPRKGAYWADISIEELSELLAALEEAQGDIITLNQKVELYEEALETYKDNRADLKRQLEEAQQRLVEKDDELTESQNESEKYQVEASLWEERYSNLSAAYRDLDNTSVEMLEVYHDTARSLAEAQQTIARLTALLDEVGVISELTEVALKGEKKSPYPTLLDTTAVLNALLARQAEEGSDKP